MTLRPSSIHSYPRRRPDMPAAGSPERSWARYPALPRVHIRAELGRPWPVTDMHSHPGRRGPWPDHCANLSGAKRTFAGGAESAAAGGLARGINAETTVSPSLITVGSVTNALFGQQLRA